MLFIALTAMVGVVLMTGVALAVDNPGVKPGKVCADRYWQCVNGCGGGRLCSTHCDQAYNRCRRFGIPLAPAQATKSKTDIAPPAGRVKPVQ